MGTSGNPRSENQKIMDMAREAPVTYDEKGKIIMPEKIPQKATIGEGVPKAPSVVSAAGVQFVDVVDQKTDKKLENAKIIQSNLVNNERLKQVQEQNKNIIEEGRASPVDHPIIGTPVVKSFTVVESPPPGSTATATTTTGTPAVATSASTATTTTPPANPNLIEMVDDKVSASKGTPTTPSAPTSAVDKKSDVNFVDMVPPVVSPAVKSGFR